MISPVPILLVEKPDLVVAADASLYDRAGTDPGACGGRVTPDGFSPTELIEAAYRAWGPALAEHLVGDYAFVIWDRQRRRLVAARDPLGMRALYWATAAGTGSRSPLPHARSPS